MSAVCAWLLTASALFRTTPAADTGALPSQSQDIFVTVSVPAESVASVHARAPGGALAADTRNETRGREPARSSDAEDLGPSTAPPWNPSRPIPRRTGWETAVGLPGRILTLPLVPIAWAADRLMLRFEKGGILNPQVLEPEGPRKVRSGFHVGLTSLGDHTGFGGRVEWTTHLLPNRVGGRLSLSHGASTAHYHDTRAVMAWKVGEINYHYEWRPQEQFYGLGMGTSDKQRSNYATQSERMQVVLGYGWNHHEITMVPRTQVRGFIGTDARVTKSGREVDVPTSEELFPELLVNTLGRRHEHMVFGVHFSTDWRTGVPHLGRGWRVLTEVERHDEPHGIVALRSNKPGAQFTRTTLEFERRFSFMRDPRTFQLLGRVIDQNISNNPERMELADYASLGGHNGLGGFEPGRFHDEDLVYGKLAYIFPLVRRFEIEVHGEVGEVSPDVWHSSRFDQLETSVGIGLRGRGLTRALGYLGFEFSREAVRFRFHTGDPDK